MSRLNRQFGILIFLCAAGLFASDASAGYLSFDEMSAQTLLSQEINSRTSGAGSSSVPLDRDHNEAPPLNLFDLSQMAMQSGPSSSGGMSSVSSSSGGHAPVAMIASPESLTPALITPLFIGDEPLSPRMLIADLFRPPRA